MTGAILRRQVQTPKEQDASERTRIELEQALSITRNQEGGLSLLEIADIIRETFSWEEVASIKQAL
jgi:hypothetical protein